MFKKQIPNPRLTLPLQGQEKLLTHTFNEVFDRLKDTKNLKTLLKTDLFKGVKNRLDQLLNEVEYGFYQDTQSLKEKKFYRIVYWNLSGQWTSESLHQLLDTHPVLKRADILCLTHAEIGMSRSNNRNLVRSLALEKSFNYIFCPSYLHLNRFSFDEKKPNQIGIEGVSILSSLPLSNVRLIPMPLCFDPMLSAEKKYGAEKALMVDLTLGHQKMSVMVLKLDAYSSCKDRVHQLNWVFESLNDDEKHLPILVAADLKTTTYNTKSNGHFLFNLMNKIIRGFDYIAKEHHLNPQIYFEKEVFETIEKHGFYFSDLNEMGKLNSQKSVIDFIRKPSRLSSFYGFMVKLLAALFFSHHDLISSRQDWFLGNSKIKVSHEPQAEKPKVVENYSLNHSEILTHTPLVLDFSLGDIHDSK